jgi:hypothetical protein
VRSLRPSLVEVPWTSSRARWLTLLAHSALTEKKAPQAGPFLQAARAVVDVPRGFDPASVLIRYFSVA